MRFDWLGLSSPILPARRGKSALFIRRRSFPRCDLATLVRDCAVLCGWAEGQYDKPDNVGEELLRNQISEWLPLFPTVDHKIWCKRC